MSAEQNRKVKGLGAMAAMVMALVVGAWTLPSSAEQEGGAMVATGQTMTIDINVPLNGIEDGQFCQAYALVYGGTAPYTFTWSGQFTNSDGSTGPLGANQIVSGNVSDARGDLLYLTVRDANNVTVNDWADMDIDSGHSYNPDCEA